MYSVLSPIGKYLKIKRVRIYDGVFLLHSKVTVLLLITFSIMISLKQYFGEPIDCISDDKKNENFINTYCWVFGTFIFDNFKGNIGHDIAAIGVHDDKIKYERLYQRYYQFVFLIFLMQALIFYIPAYLWKTWENGRLQQLCDELDVVLETDNWTSKRRQLLIKYFSTNNGGIHSWYAFRYFFCEMMNFFICVFNILILNVIFDEFWKNYKFAISTITKNDWDFWNRASSRIFPKLAKCELMKYGGSGTLQKYDILCLLPLNILNEKIFAFLWVWFLVLTLISAINIIFIICILISRRIRIALLQIRARSLTKKQVQKATEDYNIGDWFILYKVSCNINPVLFMDLMINLVEKRKKAVEV